ncbi:MAG TPA: hypothetical protein VFQ63_03275, partial [Patescibacteria group bacterium]|nr:hypothetical protein [Patescibacteria group bacterium]
MTLRHEIETILFIFLASMISTIAIIWLHRPQPQNIPPFHVVIPIQESLPTATPTPNPVSAPVVSFTDQTSSDGTQKLTMRTVQTGNMRAYTFTVSNLTTNTDRVILSENGATNSSYLVPFNAFSTDNAYVYLEKKDAQTNHFFVFKTSGESFPNGQEYLDITTRFTDYTSNYQLADVTGWGSSTLLVVNTK